MVMKIEEGRYYKFKAIKTILLPDTSESLILHGPDGKRYLLALSPYVHYNLKNKAEVVCKVDRINCTGKVFLEPEHPIYKEGEYYPFIIDSMHHNEENNRDDMVVFTVYDAFGNKVNGNAELLESSVSAGEVVKLKVARISKGRIHFSRHLTRNPKTIEQ
jgi:hypothetical protein